MTTDFRHGRNTELWLEQYDVSNYFMDLGLSADVDTAETTTFKSTWKSHITGVAAAKIDSKGYYDPTYTQLSTILQSAGNVLTAGPAGLTTVGDPARLMKVLETSYAESSPVGGAVGFTCSFQAAGNVSFGYVLHPLGTDSGTTTSSSVDDGAATTTGWTAHLHVTAVSSGSWVVKLQDSANDSTWADVTSASFTAATGATSQRLTGASGATLRRYVRYVATATGGSSPTITFGLAIARS